MAKNFQPSLFASQLERQPEVLADQGLRSNKSCPRTSPRHLFDLHKRATAQALLLAHASPEVLPNPECPMVFSACLCLPEMWSPLLTTATIFQIFVLDGSVKHMFSCTKVMRNKLHPFSKISADVFSLSYFKVGLHRQF